MEKKIFLIDDKNNILAENGHSRMPKWNRFILAENCPAHGIAVILFYQQQLIKNLLFDFKLLNLKKK